MSKARLIITAVIIEGRTQAEVAATYGLSKGWVSKLIARYNAEGETAFEPRSRRPRTSPGALDGRLVELILELRHKLTVAGLDAGPDTIAWHLEQHHATVVSRSTISRHLSRAGLVTPSPGNVRRPPTSGSKHRCRTRRGSPTSPTTGSPDPTAPQAPTWRSSAGSTTAPATHFR